MGEKWDELDKALLIGFERSGMLKPVARWEFVSTLVTLRFGSSIFPFSFFETHFLKFCCEIIGAQVDHCKC